MKNDEFRKKLIERCYRYSLNIIRMIDGLEEKDFVSQLIAKQLLRSATSIGANIVEGQSASSKRDFINFLNHSLKSANESKYWLGLLANSGRVRKEKLFPLRNETKELANILASSLLTLKGKRKI